MPSCDDIFYLLSMKKLKKRGEPPPPGLLNATHLSIFWNLETEHQAEHRPSCGYSLHPCDAGV